MAELGLSWGMGGHLKVSSADKILMDNPNDFILMGINYMGLNELMNMTNTFIILGQYTNFNLCFQRKKNLSSCALTYSKLMKYTFVNKDEALNTSSYYLIVLKFGFSSWLSCGLHLLQLDYN